MKLHHKYLAFSVLACLLLAGSACDKDKGHEDGDKMGAMGGGVGTQSTTAVYLTYIDSTGNCTQSATNGGPAATNISVPPGNAITWTMTNANSSNLQVQFAPSNPFYQYSSATASVSSGATHAPASSTAYAYQSITFTLAGANKSCANAGQLGIIMQ